MSLGDHLHNLAQHGVGTDALCLNHKAARAIDCRPCDCITRCLLDRDGFASNHALIDGRTPFEHFAVDRDFLAGPHAQIITDMDVVERDFLLAAIFPDHTCSLCRKVEQRADRLSRALAGAQFHELAKQHQDDDHRCRLEVDRDMAVHVAEAFGEDTGSKHGGNAEQP